MSDLVVTVTLSPAQRAIADAMSEATLHANVVELARVLGWRVWWVWRSVHSPEGWPDLFLLHAGRSRAIAIELKRERGRVSGAQADTLALLRRAGIPAYVVKPSHWLSGEVDAVLRGEAVSVDGRRAASARAPAPPR